MKEFGSRTYSDCVKSAAFGGLWAFSKHHFGAAIVHFPTRTTLCLVIGSMASNGMLADDAPSKRQGRIGSMCR